MKRKSKPFMPFGEEIHLLAEKLRVYRCSQQASSTKLFANGTRVAVELYKKPHEPTKDQRIIDEAIRLATEDFYHVLRLEMEEVQAECESDFVGYDSLPRSEKARLLSAAYKDRSDSGVTLVALTLPALVKARQQLVFAEASIQLEKPKEQLQRHTTPVPLRPTPADSTRI